MIEIIPFSSELRQHFYDINYQWVSKMFEVEDFDREMLSNPEKYVLDPGGHIWFAKTADLGVVGTCALMKVEDGVFELTKMGVYEKARGLKIGEQLLKYVIDYSRNSKHKTLFLLTNKDCGPAIHLYEKNGFEHSLEIMEKYGQKYERCNVAMKLSK